MLLRAVSAHQIQWQPEGAAPGQCYSLETAVRAELLTINNALSGADIHLVRAAALLLDCSGLTADQAGTAITALGKEAFWAGEVAVVHVRGKPNTFVRIQEDVEAASAAPAIPGARRCAPTDNVAVRILTETELAEFSLARGGPPSMPENQLQLQRRAAQRGTLLLPVPAPAAAPAPAPEAAPAPVPVFPGAGPCVWCPFAHLARAAPPSKAAMSRVIKTLCAGRTELDVAFSVGENTPTVAWLAGGQGEGCPGFIVEDRRSAGTAQNLRLVRPHLRALLGLRDLSELVAGGFITAPLRPHYIQPKVKPPRPAPRPRLASAPASPPPEDFSLASALGSELATAIATRSINIMPVDPPSDVGAYVDELAAREPPVFESVVMPFSEVAEVLADDNDDETYASAYTSAHHTEAPSPETVLAIKELRAAAPPASAADLVGIYDMLVGPTLGRVVRTAPFSARALSDAVLACPGAPAARPPLASLETVPLLAGVCARLVSQFVGRPRNNDSYLPRVQSDVYTPPEWEGMPRPEAPSADTPLGTENTRTRSDRIDIIAQYEGKVSTLAAARRVRNRDLIASDFIGMRPRRAAAAAAEHELVDAPARRGSSSGSSSRGSIRRNTDRDYVDYESETESESDDEYNMSNIHVPRRDYGARRAEAARRASASLERARGAGAGAGAGADGDKDTEAPAPAEVNPATLARTRAPADSTCPDAEWAQHTAQFIIDNWEFCADDATAVAALGVAVLALPPALRPSALGTGLDEMALEDLIATVGGLPPVIDRLLSSSEPCLPLAGQAPAARVVLLRYLCSEAAQSQRVRDRMDTVRGEIDDALRRVEELTRQRKAAEKAADKDKAAQAALQAAEAAAAAAEAALTAQEERMSNVLSTTTDEISLKKVFAPLLEEHRRLERELRTRNEQLDDAIARQAGSGGRRIANLDHDIARAQHRALTRAISLTIPLGGDCEGRTYYVYSAAPATLAVCTPPFTTLPRTPEGELVRTGTEPVWTLVGGDWAGALAGWARTAGEAALAADAAYYAPAATVTHLKNDGAGERVAEVTEFGAKVAALPDYLAFANPTFNLGAQRVQYEKLQESDWNILMKN